MPPGLTLLFAVKLDCRTIAAKPGDPAENWRWSNATSDGELTLVGTFGVENIGGPLVLPTLESAGKTRYTSTTTFFISLVDAPDGIRPVKAAAVINICWVSTKSSPVSISNFPALSCRVEVAGRPSGLPVLKTNASAAAGNGITTAANASAAIPVRAFKEKSASSVMIFLRRLWKIVAIKESRRQLILRLVFVKPSFIMMGALPLGPQRFPSTMKRLARSGVGPCQR